MTTSNLEFIRPKTRIAVQIGAAGLCAITGIVWIAAGYMKPGLPEDIGSSEIPGKVETRAIAAVDHPLSQTAMPPDIQEPIQAATGQAEATDTAVVQSPPAEDPSVPKLVSSNEPPGPAEESHQKTASSSDMSDRDVLKEMRAMNAGRKGSEGTTQPRYLLRNLSSYELLFEHGGLLVAHLDRSRVAFGNSMSTASVRPSLIHTWANDMPGFSKRVAFVRRDLPGAQPAFQEMLQVMKSFNGKHGTLHVAVPENVDAQILKSQLSACRKLGLPEDESVITAGILSEALVGDLKFDVDTISQPSTGRTYRRFGDRWKQIGH